MELFMLPERCLWLPGNLVQWQITIVAGYENIQTLRIALDVNLWKIMILVLMQYIYIQSIPSNIFINIALLNSLIHNYINTLGFDAYEK